MEHLQEMVQEVTDMFAQHKKYTFSSGPKKVEEILRACLTFKNMVTMLKDNKDWFDFSVLCSEQKTILLSEDYKTFSELFVVDDLPQTYKIELFIQKPAKLKEFINFEKVSKLDMAKIARQRPSYFKKYNLPLNGIATDGWKRLVGYSTDYIHKFMENIHTVKNKSELRQFLVYKPEIIPHLTVEVIQRSALTAKEWILFMNWPDMRNKDVMYNDEVLNWIDMEFSCEVLSGEQVTSRHTDKARKLLEEFKDE